MPRIEIPPDLPQVLNGAWQKARQVPGFLTEDEARFLGLLAACAPGDGAILEIGSFKGKSTVMLGTVARHYGRGPVVAIDPHNFNNRELAGYRTAPEASSYDEFLRHVDAAGVAGIVEPHRSLSTDIAPKWARPLRVLWIDGDHSYAGAKADFDGFLPHLIPGGVVAFHDALHEFAGPIRVFVDEVLRSDRFGAAGFVGSIAWAQYRPQDGTEFGEQRAALEIPAARLVPYVRDEQELHGLRRLAYKLHRARVPRKAIAPPDWAALVNR